MQQSEVEKTDTKKPAEAPLDRALAAGAVLAMLATAALGLVRIAGLHC